ncbi:MAG: M28 family peptidase [Thermofilum sp.]
MLRERLEAKGRLFPPSDAVAGSPEERQIIDHAAAELEGLGLDVGRYSFECMSWREKYTEVSVKSHRFSAVAMPYSPSAEIEGELVHVGDAAHPRDWEGLDLSGKVALVQLYRKLDEATWQYIEAVLHGAEAVIFYDRFPSRRRRMVVLFSLDYRFGPGAPPPVPAVAVSFEDGVRLTKTARRGEKVSVRVEAEVDHAATSQVVFAGDLSGPVISAHADKWLSGFTDDVLGVGMLLELARELREGAGYVLFGAEESGAPAYSPWYWIWGSRSFVKHLARAGSIGEFGALLNLDTLGGARLRIAASGPDFAEALRELAGAEVGPDSVLFDSFSFTMAGIPAATFHTFPELWSVYHSDADTSAAVNWEGVERAYRAVVHVAKVLAEKRWSLMRYDLLVSSILEKLERLSFLREARELASEVAKLRVGCEEEARELRRALTRAIFRGHYETELVESEVVYPYQLDVADDLVKLREALAGGGSLDAALRGLRRVPGFEQALPSLEPLRRSTLSQSSLREYYTALERAVLESLAMLREAIASLRR